MRTYTFLVMGPGHHFLNWPGRFITSEARIRVVALVMFRKWFGRRATSHWHKDGFMAEAWDRRGNRIQIEQFNAYRGCLPDYTLLALPWKEAA
ncbi:MAG: hypothetical protein ACJ74Y_10730 [Bryobacteraceae bacterium]